MVDGDVGDPPLAPQQVGALPVHVHDGQRLIVLEGVEAPPPLGHAGLGGLAVLDHHPSEGVGVLNQRPRQLKVGLLLVGRVGCRVFVVLLVACSEGSSPSSSLLLLRVLSMPCSSVLPPLVVMALPFRLLLLECVSVSLPLSSSPTSSLSSAPTAASSLSASSPLSLPVSISVSIPLSLPLWLPWPLSFSLYGKFLFHIVPAARTSSRLSSPTVLTLLMDKLHVRNDPIQTTNCKQHDCTWVLKYNLD